MNGELGAGWRGVLFRGRISLSHVSVKKEESDTLYRPFRVYGYVH
jgi:hypothetical protein